MATAARWLHDVSLSRKGLVVIAIPLVGLLSVVLAFFLVQRETTEASAWVGRTLEIRAQVQSVRTLVEEAETAAADYFAMRRPADLRSFQQASQDLPPALDTLERMVGHDSSRQSRVRQLRTLLLERLRQLEVHGSASDDDAVAPRERARTALAAIAREEDRLLDERRARGRNLQRSGNLVILCGLLLVPVAALLAMRIYAAAIARRMALLEQNATRLAAGEPISPMPSGLDEIGRVERSLGQAASLLAQRERDLRSLATVLEERVQQRTAELAADVLVRTRAEDELADTLRRYRAVIAASPLAILSVNPHGIVQTWNRAAEVIFGWTAGEIVGRSGAPILAAEGESEAQWIAGLSSAEAMSEVERHGRHRDGSPREVRLWTAPLHDASDLFSGIIAIAADFTDQRRLEQQFAQAQKMEAIGRLAGGAAHDFNNLITVIAGYGQMLQDAVAGTPELETASEEVLKAADRAAALARQLLAFSRRQVIQPQVLDLNSVVAGIERMLSRVIGEDIELHTELSANLATVLADPGQLEQVIVNLAVNARDAMPDGGKLTIETANVTLDEHYTRTHPVKPGEYVMLAVSDNGEGMSAEVKSHLFEPFFTTKEKGKGTGLGLSTVYGIVKQHGGNVWVYSEPGQGTTLKIFLPRAAEAPAQAPLPGAVPRAALQGHETVLLVEDEAAVRRLISDVLVMRGYRVLEAESGQTALQLAAQYEGEIRLLLTDVVMPHMGGRELAARFHALRPNTRVLFLSGYSDAAAVEHGVLDSGAAFLQKPFTPEVLARKVRELLDVCGAAGA